MGTRVFDVAPEKAAKAIDDFIEKSGWTKTAAKKTVPLTYNSRVTDFKEPVFFVCHANSTKAGMRVTASLSARIMVLYSIVANSLLVYGCFLTLGQLGEWSLQLAIFIGVLSALLVFRTAKLVVGISTIEEKFWAFLDQQLEYTKAVSQSSIYSFDAFFSLVLFLISILLWLWLSGLFARPPILGSLAIITLFSALLVGTIKWPSILAWKARLAHANYAVAGLGVSVVIAYLFIGTIHQLTDPRVFIPFNAPNATNLWRQAPEDIATQVTTLEFNNQQRIPNKIFNFIVLPPVREKIPNIPPVPQNMDAEEKIVWLVNEMDNYVRIQQGIPVGEYDPYLEYSRQKFEGTTLSWGRYSNIAVSIIILFFVGLLMFFGFRRFTRDVYDAYQSKEHYRSSVDEYCMLSKQGGWRNSILLNITIVSFWIFATISLYCGMFIGLNAVTYGIWQRGLPSIGFALPLSWISTSTSILLGPSIGVPAGRAILSLFGATILVLGSIPVLSLMVAIVSQSYRVLRSRTGASTLAAYVEQLCEKEHVPKPFLLTPEEGKKGIVTYPFLIFPFRSVIEFPQNIRRDVTESEAKALLAHEIAHIKQDTRAVWFISAASTMTLFRQGFLALIIDFPHRELEADIFALHAPACRG